MFTASRKVMLHEFTVLHLLSVSWGSVPGSIDDLDRDRKNHLKLSLYALSTQFYCLPHIFPVTGSLGDIITSSFGVLPTVVVLGAKEDTDLCLRCTSITTS